MLNITSRLILTGAFIILGFAQTVKANDAPVFRWACSASKLTPEGTTEEILNVVFIPPEASRAVIYANAEYRIRFERYQNPLDGAWEIALSLHTASSDEELFRVFAEENESVGFKQIQQHIGGYCHSRSTH